MKQIQFCFIHYLISCRHHSHHREFLDLHLRDSNSGKEADLRGAHVGAFGQHTLATLDVMTDRPVTGRQTGLLREKPQEVGNQIMDEI